MTGVGEEASRGVVATELRLVNSSSLVGVTGHCSWIEELQQPEQQPEQQPAAVDVYSRRKKVAAKAFIDIKKDQPKDRAPPTFKFNLCLFGGLACALDASPPFPGAATRPLAIVATNSMQIIELLSGRVTPFLSLLAPPARARHACAVHPITKRVIVHGGAGRDSLLSDVWLWDPAERYWSERTCVGDRPPACCSHAIQFDSAGRFMYLVGGMTSKGLLLSFMWQLNFEAQSWERVELRNEQPSPRCNHRLLSMPPPADATVSAFIVHHGSVPADMPPVMLTVDTGSASKGGVAGALVIGEFAAKIERTSSSPKAPRKPTRSMSVADGPSSHVDTPHSAGGKSSASSRPSAVATAASISALPASHSYGAVLFHGAVHEFGGQTTTMESAAAPSWVVMNVNTGAVAKVPAGRSSGGGGCLEALMQLEGMSVASFSDDVGVSLVAGGRNCITAQLSNRVFLLDLCAASSWVGSAGGADSVPPLRSRVPFIMQWAFPSETARAAPDDQPSANANLRRGGGTTIRDKIAARLKQPYDREVCAQTVEEGGADDEPLQESFDAAPANSGLGTLSEYEERTKHIDLYQRYAQLRRELREFEARRTGVVKEFDSAAEKPREIAIRSVLRLRRAAKQMMPSSASCARGLFSGDSISNVDHFIENEARKIRHDPLAMFVAHNTPRDRYRRVYEKRCTFTTGRHNEQRWKYSSVADLNSSVCTRLGVSARAVMNVLAESQRSRGAPKRPPSVRRELPPYDGVLASILMRRSSAQQQTDEAISSHRHSPRLPTRLCD